MADIQYKCPNCGGALGFDSSLQKVKCPFCDTEFAMEALKSLDEDMESDATGDSMEWASSGNEWADGETDGMQVYICKSCGGEIIGDSNTGSTKCPYCDSPIVMKGQFSGSLKPDRVIPFKLDKEAAKAEFEKHLKGKKLLNRAFTNNNHIEEIKGVYVPYWLFDTKASGAGRFKATKERRWSDARYEYTETSFYSVMREGNMAFEHVPVDGSSKMDDALMESLEPYDYKDAVDFQTAYLAGYMADKYDVDSETSEARANERVKTSMQAALKDTVTGYDTVSFESGNTQLEDGRVEYALYPVWILNTVWNDTKYTFAMNGQTGKFVGDLPLDKAAYKSWLIKLTLIFTAVFMGVSSLIYLFS